MLFYVFEEFKHFLSVEDDLRNRCFFKTLYFCEISKGKIRVLNWNDIKFKNNTITINKGISDNVNGKRFIISSTKTKSSKRTLPFT